MFVIHYTTPSQPQVAEFDTKAAAESFVASLPEDRSAVMEMGRVPTVALVALWNRANPEKQIKKFENRRIAESRVEIVLGGLAVVDRESRAREAAKEAIRVNPEKTPTPAPEAKDKKGSPAKGKRLGVGARMAALIREEKSTDEILEIIRREFPDSRAGKSDVSIVRGKVKKGIL